LAGGISEPDGSSEPGKFAQAAQIVSYSSTKITKLKNKISETFVSFVIFVVSESEVIVPGYPYRSLKSHCLKGFDDWNRIVVL